MEVGPVDARSLDGVIPVLGNGPAGNNAAAYAEQTICAEPHGEYGEESAGEGSLEDSHVLHRDGELDGELGEAVADDSRIQRDEELLELIQIDSASKTEPNL